MKQLIFLFGLCTFIVACKPIEPIIPTEQLEEIPQINHRESTLSLPIKINLQPYLTQTEKSLPKTFTGKEENCEGVSYSYKFTREPIQFEGKGEYLSYDVDGKYLLYLNYCPNCTSLFDSKGTCVIPRIYASCGVGEPMRRVSVAYTTKFKISPDFKFKTTTELTKFQTIDPCEITVFSYDATDKLRKEVTTVLNDLEKDIDDQIASIDIRSDIEEVWKMLASPTSLGKYGYFTAYPKAVSLSDIRFDKKTAYIDLNLTFIPQISTHQPEMVVPKLPNLSEHKAQTGFNIDVDIVAGYDSLSSILTSELKGKSVTIKNNEVIFTGIQIQGAASKQLNLKVDFEGKRKGTLYLVGTPVFDSTAQKIYFPDLTFDLKTKDALLKSAKWMFNTKITNMMREFAIFDLTPHLKDMKNMVQKEMKRELTKGVKLNGTVKDLKLVGIYPQLNQLIIRINSTGDLKLSM
ncbi:MAG: hypothetical protein RI922_2457 [Bacteroidota bacterium]|jgi:hypothetical protein